MAGWTTTYTAVSEGRRDKRVKCERCNAEYVYTIARSATAQRSRFLSIGGDAAEASASEEASNELALGLYLGVDPRPCPKCGYFQANMQHAAEKLRLSWLDFGMYPYFFIGFVLFGLFCAYLNVMIIDRKLVVPWLVLGLLLLPFAGFLILIPYIRRRVLRNYNPNDLTAEQRAHRGFHPGVPADEYEAVTREEADCLVELKEHAAALLALPHPVGDKDGAEFKELLTRYVRGDMFFDGAFQSGVLASLNKSRRRAMTNAEDQRAYYRESIRVFTGIYITAFGRSPIRF